MRKAIYWEWSTQVFGFLVSPQELVVALYLHDLLQLLCPPLELEHPKISCTHPPSFRMDKVLCI